MTATTQHKKGSSRSRAANSQRPKWQTTTISAVAEIAPFLKQLQSALAELGYSSPDVRAIRLATDEALVNAVKHGNRNDPTKSVRIRYRLQRTQMEMEIADEGTGFNPTTVPDPTAPENLEKPGGRGLYLMRHYMTSVRFNTRGNKVVMCKTCAAPE